MADHHSVTLEQGYGYSGKRGCRAWVAAITGTDPHYGFARTFLDPTHVERDHFGRPRYIATSTYQLEPGLYQLSERGDRWFTLVWKTKDGHVKATRPDDTRVQTMAALLDAGHSVHDARIATKRATTPTTMAVAE